MPPALELHGVYKKFRRGELFDSLRDLLPALARRVLSRGSSDALGEREFWALQDVSFAVERGEALGIIGPNGAGKSTMLKLLSGIMRPTKGDIQVRGRLSALIEVSAGFHPDLTGRENIFLNGTILGMTRQEIRARFDEIVAFSGLEEFIDTPVKRYSSGMFARLGFSVAAHVDPDLLIVDEVLSVGDFAFQRKCLERMSAVLRSGATVIFVSHNLRAVTGLCDRAVLLERGRVVASGPSAEVVETYLSRNEEQRAEGIDRDAYISNVDVRDGSGARVDFSSGSTAWIDVRVGATRRTERLAVVLELTDGEHYRVFDTSTERLGTAAFTLEAGATCECTFEITLHLAPGTYHVNAYVYRYDVQREYDRWLGAATVLVSADHDVRGVVNLYPVVRRCAIAREASSTPSGE